MRIKQSEVYLKACVTSIFGAFHATRDPYVFQFVCGVQKNISRKKYRHVSKVTIEPYLWTTYQEF